MIAGVLPYRESHPPTGNCTNQGLLWYLQLYQGSELPYRILSRLSLGEQKGKIPGQFYRGFNELRQTINAKLLFVSTATYILLRTFAPVATAHL